MNKQQRQHLQKAATHYLQRTHRDNNARCPFNVIAIEDDCANAYIDWIKNTFKT